MAAHGGLRQLQDRADLVDGQLVPFERQEDPAADRVGQRGHVIEDWCGSHVFIRISGLRDYTVAAMRRQGKGRIGVGPRNSPPPGRIRDRSWVSAKSAGSV